MLLQMYLQSPLDDELRMRFYCVYFSAAKFPWELHSVFNHLWFKNYWSFIKEEAEQLMYKVNQFKMCQRDVYRCLEKFKATCIRFIIDIRFPLSERILSIKLCTEWCNCFAREIALQDPITSTLKIQSRFFLKLLQANPALNKLSY